MPEKYTCRFLTAVATELNVVRRITWNPRWIACGIITLGMALRLTQYLANRVLWLDEARLALNIVNRSMAELAQPVLERLQAAPFLFLAIEKGMVTTFGANEYALRAFPLFAGVSSLFLFWLLAKHCLSITGALIALFLFAVSNSLIYFSAEVKQYASDVAAVLLVYIMAIRLHQEELTLGRTLLIGGTGAVLIWLSHPLLFVLAAVVITLFVDAAWRRMPRRMAHYALIGTLWALSFSLEYLMILQGLSVDAGFQEWWGEVENAFAPLPFSRAGIAWYGRAIPNLMRTPGGFLAADFPLFVALVGGVALWSNEKKRELFLLLLPLVFVLVASSLHRYPLSGRLMLFFVPTLLLLIASGVSHLLTLTSRGRSVIAAAALCFLLPVGGEYSLLSKPKAKDEIKPAIQYLERSWQPGDVVYLYYAAEPSFKFYWPHNGGSYITGVRSRDNWHKYIDDLDQLRGKHRVWVFFSHVFTPVKKAGERVSEQDFFLQYLDRIGTRIDAFTTEGGSAYLYDLSAANTVGRNDGHS
jgi:hypothetical protein